MVVAMAEATARVAVDMEEETVAETVGAMGAASLAALAALAASSVLAAR